MFAFARHSLDSRVRNRHDAEEWFGAPVIGTLPPRIPSEAIGLSGAKPRRRDNEAVEAIQLLRANFQFGASSVSGPTVLVTSDLEGEGKTTVVANLGLALALAGKDVVCVEGDVRSPALHRLLGVKQSTRGLADVIEGRASLDDVLDEVPLLVSPKTGGRPTSPAGSCSCPRAPVVDGAPPRAHHGCRADLSSGAEYVIFDSSPLLSGGEALPLAVDMDGVLVVAREGRTTREGAQAVRTTLDGLGADKVAVVLIDASQPLSSYTADCPRLSEWTLITGGAGYVGSVVAEELMARGRPVRVVDSLADGNVPSLLHLWGHAGFEFVRGDIRDPIVRESVLRGVRSVVHLAAVVGDPACGREPDLARDVNLQGTRDLLADAEAAGAGRFVFASTCSNYGKMADGDTLATEEWELRPVSLYAETKVAASTRCWPGPGTACRHAAFASRRSTARPLVCASTSR